MMVLKLKRRKRGLEGSKHKSRLEQRKSGLERMEALKLKSMAKTAVCSAKRRMAEAKANLMREAAAAASQVDLERPPEDDTLQEDLLKNTYTAAEGRS